MRLTPSKPSTLMIKSRNGIPTLSTLYQHSSQSTAMGLWVLLAKGNRNQMPFFVWLAPMAPIRSCRMTASINTSNRRTVAKTSICDRKMAAIQISLNSFQPAAMKKKSASSWVMESFTLFASLMLQLFIELREGSFWNLIREERKVNKTNGIFGCSKINTFSGFNQFLVNYSFLKLYAYHLSINNQ